MKIYWDWLYHPRKLWIRKACFQIHVWAGVLLSLYVITIALSGSVLVFEDELTGVTFPPGLSSFDPNHVATIPQIIEGLRRQEPGASVTLITVPTKTIPAYQLDVRLPGVREQRYIADPATGRLFKVGRTWVQWIHDLHVSLLLNASYGIQLNAVGAGVLLFVIFTGIVLWWPGIRIWVRGLRVNVRASWKRINFDLHSAIGFWTFALLFWWALSGVYFGFYKQVTAVVNTFAPVRNMRPPVPEPASTSATRLPLGQILAIAQAASPRGHLYSLSNASLAESVVYASIGDWILWLMHPLHFGTLWGTAVKILWAFLCVTLAILTAPAC